jgi:endonuclease YncB( thermonuclease family)
VLAVCAGSAAPAEAQRVRQVIDGDTITVSGVGVVRLIGVDAPEKTGSYRESEPFGDAATLRADLARRQGCAARI